MDQPETFRGIRPGHTRADEVKAILGEPVETKADARYQFVRGLTEWAFPDVRAHVYLRDGVVQLLTDVPPEVEERKRLPTIDGCLRRLGEAELRLPHEWGRSYQLYVFPEHGFAAVVSRMTKNIVLREYFPPMSAHDYCEHIYQAPSNVS